MTKRLLIASPAKGGVPLHFIILQEQLIRNPPDGWEIDFVLEAANSILNISRNILANNAITSPRNYDAMLGLDTDHPLRREHFDRILSHDLEKYPIVSSLYCIKRPGKPFMLGMREKGTKEDENHMLPAAFLPTGCVRYSVAALRQIRDFHKDREVYIQDDVLLPPGVKRGNGTMTELFPFGACGPRTPAARLKRVRKAMETIMAKGVGCATRPQLIEAAQKITDALTDEGAVGFLLGEDYHASLLARQAGVKQFLDLACLVPHKGEITYPITDPAVLTTSFDPIPEYEGDPEEW